MPKTDAFEQHWPKIFVALLLTFASGLVDIVGYLGIFHYFTAHLTGTTVHLAETLVERNRTEFLSAGAIVAAFFLGSIAGRVIIEAGFRGEIRRIATATLAIEAAILVALCEVATASSGMRAGLADRPYWGLAALAAAMGIQTATLTGIGPLTVHTTFVTGMVNKLAQLVSHIAFRAYDLLRGRKRDAASLQQWREDIKRASFLTLVWVFYVGGAAFGTWAFVAWELRALLVAVALLIIGITVDQFSPLSVREEIEQSER